VKAAAEAKAKAEADMKAERAKIEAERTKMEAERKAREEEDRRRREAEEKARKEAEERARKDAEERAKKEAEERARREEEERKRREEEERRRKEEEARRAKEAEEKARKEAEERARREEEERKRREEEERKRREEEERRRKEEEARRAKEAEERAKREAEEKARKEAEERARREAEDRERREAEDRERREADERRQREEDERRRKDEEQRAAEALAKASAETTPKAPPAKPACDFADSLLADLDSFGAREAEEQKAKEAAELKAKKEAEERARREAEERARKEREEQARKDAEERAKREAEERSRREAEEREREEEERRKAAEAERKRKVQEAMAASRAQAAKSSQAGAGAAAAKGKPADNDIGITDDDLDLEDVKQDEKALTAEARRREREKEREAKRAERAVAEREAEPEAAPLPARPRRPIKWGKPLAIGLFVLLVAGIGVLHVMPIGTADYERAASEAIGRPVKIGSGNLSLFTGAQLQFSGVTVGDVKIGSVRAFPQIGSLLGERKHFKRIELDGVALPQAALGDVAQAKIKPGNFSVERISAKKMKLEGPLTLPQVDGELVFDAAGGVSAATLRGADNLVVKLAPKENQVEFEMSAGSFTIPIAPEISLSGFGMKGTATAQGMEVSQFDGTLTGNAQVRWGSSWNVEGVLTVRALNAAVFAPALLSEGKAEGTGKFSLSGAEPAKLGAGGRLEGNFTVTKGVLGSFDLSRALQTSGRQTSGRTPFTEMTGQGSYNAGAVALRNVSIGAGAMNAGASADIAPGGALSGRIIADVRSSAQTLRATLTLGGTLKDPQVKN
jgi:hypothetical protein